MARFYTVLIAFTLTRSILKPHGEGDECEFGWDVGENPPTGVDDVLKDGVRATMCDTAHKITTTALGWTLKYLSGRLQKQLATFAIIANYSHQWELVRNLTHHTDVHDYNSNIIYTPPHDFSCGGASGLTAYALPTPRAGVEMSGSYTFGRGGISRWGILVITWITTCAMRGSWRIV